MSAVRNRKHTTSDAIESSSSSIRFENGMAASEGMVSPSRRKNAGESDGRSPSPSPSSMTTTDGDEKE